MSEIKTGDTVLCILPPAVNPGGQPAERPRLGKSYTCSDTYVAPYGLGIKLEELNPFPYDGYVLWASPENSLHVAGGWYFVKLTQAGV